MEIEAWRNINTGEVRFVYNVTPSFFFEGEWMKLGVLDIAAVPQTPTPTLIEVEIEDEPTDQGSDAED